MDKVEIKQISENYYHFLKSENRFKPLEDQSIEFYSPVLDFFGDSISINIKNRNNEYILSDYGETIWNLEQNGLNVLDDKKSKKYEILTGILNSEKVKLNGDILEKKTNSENLSQNIHDFIQLISTISQLSILKRENVKTFFRDEVIHYFLENRKEYFKNVMPDVRIDGKSRLTHKFDLAFPNDTTDFVRIMKTVNTSNVKNLMFDWEDVAQYRDKLYQTESRLNIIMDGQNNIPSDVRNISEEYNVRIYNFSDKEKIINTFSLN